MNNKSLGTATLAVLGFAVLPAQTDSITQTASVPQQSTDITNEVLLPLIEKFNTALGTLNQVIVEFDGRIVTTT
ncbi:MAG: choice-of-anchor E domain-containing protein, partial [Cyanobacteria bacterium J06626_23]